MKKQILIIFYTLLPVTLLAQIRAKDFTSDCPADTMIKVRFCNWPRFSGTTCETCKDCAAKLVVEDSAFKIESFIVYANGDGFEEGLESRNEDGNWISNSLRLFRNARPGATLVFSCIKARHKNGKLYTLLPITLMLY
jgi:hypothetical protein